MTSVPASMLSDKEAGHVPWEERYGWWQTKWSWGTLCSGVLRDRGHLRFCSLSSYNQLVLTPLCPRVIKVTEMTFRGSLSELTLKPTPVFLFLAALTKQIMSHLLLIAKKSFEISFSFSVSVEHKNGQIMCLSCLRWKLCSQ